MGDILRSIAILIVFLIPLVVATKDAEFKYECFKNHKNYKGKTLNLIHCINSKFHS